MSQGESYIASPRILQVTLIILILGLGLTIFLWPKPVVVSTVRVRNNSAVALANVSMGSRSYGNLQVGAQSEYQTWGPVYPDEHLELDAGGVHLSRDPDDYYGEKPLGPGRFTFSIVLEPKNPVTGFSTKVHRD